MIEPFNVWGIKEYEGDGVSCPAVPVNLPWGKKALLFFFRFGVCPVCLLMSVSYAFTRFVTKRFVRQ